jgi:hypothetical protein
MARQLIKPDSENAIQAAFFKWCGLMERKFPELALIHSIPNGAHKSHASRYVFKITGLKSGVPDVSFPVARCGFHGMYIEFKSKTGRISPEQRWWTDKLTEQGFLVLTCRDWETAAQFVEEYLSGTFAIRSTPEKK